MYITAKYYVQWIHTHREIPAVHRIVVGYMEYLALIRIKNMNACLFAMIRE